MERERREGKTQWSAGADIAQVAAELAGRVVPAAPTAGSVIGHADLTFPNSLGVPRKISRHRGKHGRNQFLEEPSIRTVGSGK